MQAQDLSSPKPIPRVRVSPHIWEQLKPDVEKIYCVQGKTLRETRQILEKEYGLQAS